MPKSIGFGIVGAGAIAPMHIKAIQESKGGRLVAICDIDHRRAEKLSAEFAIKPYHNIESLLADREIEVVCVATPNHLHRDSIIACACAGKHVLTEKPPAMTLAETDKMIAACDKEQVKFGCFVQCRMRKAIQAIKQAITSGRFGKLLHVDAYMKWYRPDSYYGGAVWRSSRRNGSGVTVAQAFHYIDLLYYLAGPVFEVEAKMMNLAHPQFEIEDTCISCFKFANGPGGVLQASTAFWPGTDVRIEVYGTDGMAVAVGDRITDWKFKQELNEDGQIRQIGDISPENKQIPPADHWWADHAAVIQDMIEIIGTDRQPIIPVRDVRPTVEIMLAMYHSAAFKKVVQLPVRDNESVWQLLH